MFGWKKKPSYVNPFIMPKNWSQMISPGYLLKREDMKKKYMPLDAFLKGVWLLQQKIYMSEVTLKFNHQTMTLEMSTGIVSRKERGTPKVPVTRYNVPRDIEGGEGEGKKSRFNVKIDFFYRSLFFFNFEKNKKMTICESPARQLLKGNYNPS